MTPQLPPETETTKTLRGAVALALFAVVAPLWAAAVFWAVGVAANACHFMVGRF